MKYLLLLFLILPAYGNHVGDFFNFSTELPSASTTPGVFQVQEDIEATHCSRMVSDSNLTGDEIKAFLTNLCLKNRGKDL